ncbi:sulfatase-like hydrolase/transferase [Niabella hibiscisoli]|uniref:sulfatase-like hydrolase/transferase n=1 Tax=Niabella hibiscisoli TaxID=1825928 RepID=UPI001F0DD4F3|nr:sulfatase-like hydrolase/transferase [Niabella hibiscisoli]MCH5714804.1 sulfatase-like hydrolase/transferase [Niabella hibiscisoli]
MPDFFIIPYQHVWICPGIKIAIAILTVLWLFILFLTSMTKANHTIRLVTTGITLLIFSAFLYPLHAQRKPNMIIFLADDLNQQDIGAYGNREVKTPNMDQLAKEGMRFNNAYAASSMCTPSRSAMFTGLYPFRNGAQMNHFTVHAGIKSLPHYLQQQGYRVVISGKIHMAPLENFPFEHIGKEFGQYSPVENRLDRKKETVRAIETHFNQHPEQPICLVVAPGYPMYPGFLTETLIPPN